MKPDAPKMERMRIALAGFLSVIAAAAAPALIVLVGLVIDMQGRVLSRAGFFGFLTVFVVALAHAMVLGLPVTLALVHRKALRVLPMLVAGACVGMLPFGLLLLALRPAGNWAGFFGLLAAMAGLGAAGSLAFFFTHRLISPRPSTPA